MQVAILDGESMIADVVTLVDEAVDVASEADIGHGKGEMSLGGRADPEFRHRADQARNAGGFGDGEHGSRGREAARFGNIDIEDVRRIFFF